MIIKLIQFDEKGGIFCYREISNLPRLLESNELVVDRYYSGDEHYVNSGIIEKRPNQSTQLQGATLRNLPIPCQIYINGTMYECDDGIAELSFNQPTSYHIKVVAFPFLDWEVTIENQT